MRPASFPLAKLSSSPPYMYKDHGATLQSSVPAAAAIWAWSSSEPVRYLYLILYSVGLSPYWLLWLRCVSFCFPIGPTGSIDVSDIYFWRDVLEVCMDYPSGAKLSHTYLGGNVHELSSGGELSEMPIIRVPAEHAARSSPPPPPNRYTQFIPLYPLGMLGELGILYLSAQLVHTLEPLAQLPQAEYVMYALCVLWPIAWFPLYKYMFTQRRNKLGTAPTKND